jgi:predicted RNase H-like HicB family nuclease
MACARADYPNNQDNPNARKEGRRTPQNAFPSPSAGGHLCCPSCCPMIGPAPMLNIETEREDDGRWVGEVAALAGVLAYGATEAEARAKAAALALRVIADRLDHGEPVPAEARDVFGLT